MSPAPHIHAGEFINDVKAVLAGKDANALVKLCRSRWSNEQISSLLCPSNRDACKLASLALSMIGDEKSVSPLVELLSDEDAMVNQMAEHALWAIWFRMSTAEANQALMRGVKLMNGHELSSAIEHFNEAILLDPDFAEAYNQRAIAHYLEEHFEASLSDCRDAVRLNAKHFGAWAGMGHCYAQLHRCDKAADAYRKAIALNPHLQCVQEAIDHLCGEDEA